MSEQSVPDPNQTVASDPERALQPSTVAVGRYAVGRLLAQGGMGAVYTARDTTLDREVAVKTLLPGADALRFVIESKITAKLPHPNIPPVYELGTLPDGMPFLAMKFVRGRTLSDILHGRSHTATDLPQMLTIFEQVCQAVGFAHAQGIIHRDLKPANVMVGEFGEVQVMDWGLAKELRVTVTRANTSDRVPNTNNTANANETLDTPQFSDTQERTQTGVGMGTPAFMPPEQARGEWHAVDTRADVFALGGILCVILAGRAPFTGNGIADVMKKAERGDVAEAHAALDACGADAELIALAKKCLHADTAKRPATGLDVANAVAAYRVSMEERLRAAETERAAAVVKFNEQRKRRRVQLGLAFALGVILLGAGAFSWWQDRQATDRRAKAAQARDTVKSGIAQAKTLQEQARFREAATALQAARELAASGTPELVPEVELAQRNLELVRTLDQISYSKWIFVQNEDTIEAPPPISRGSQGEVQTPQFAFGKYDTQKAADRYRDTFRDAGFDITSDDRAALVGFVQTSAVGAEVLAALDDWVICETNEDTRNRVLAVLREADPGSWLNQFRDPKTWKNPEILERLRGEIDLKTVSSAVLVAFSKRLSDAEIDSMPLLRSALVNRPNDFSILTMLSHGTAQRVPLLAVGYYRAALAVRPNDADTLNNLGVLLDHTGDLVGANEVLRLAVRELPTLANARVNLAGVMYRQKNYADAIVELREAIRLSPNFGPAHNALGAALGATGDKDAAVRAYREAVRCMPKSAVPLYNIARIYSEKKEYAKAIAEYRQAVKLEPGLAVVHFALGTDLRESGDIPGAIAAFEQAVKLEPKALGALIGLGNLYQATGRFADAAKQFNTAIEADPKNAAAFNGLGLALRSQGKLDEAVAAFRRAADLSPLWADPLSNAGVVLTDQNKPAEAEASFRAAIAREPKSALAHNGYGTLLSRFNPPAALKEFELAFKLNPQLPEVRFNYPKALYDVGRAQDAIREYDASIAVFPNDARLFLGKGVAQIALGQFEEAARTLQAGRAVAKDQPALQFGFDNTLRSMAFLPQVPTLAAEVVAGKRRGNWRELVPLLDFAVYTQRFSEATWIRQAIFALEPKLTENPREALRWFAARDAIRAKPETKALSAPGGAALTLEQLARLWLREELNALVSLARRNASKDDDILVYSAFNAWLTEPAFARVREPDMLRLLPPAEAAQWRDLWTRATIWRDKTAPQIAMPREK